MFIVSEKMIFCSMITLSPTCMLNSILMWWSTWISHFNITCIPIKNCYSCIIYKPYKGYATEIIDSYNCNDLEIYKSNLGEIRKPY